MNILMLRSDLAMAGPGITAIRLALALKELGHTVRIATSGGKMVPEFEEVGIPVDIIPQLARDSRGILTTWRAMYAVRQLVRDHSINVMHSFNAHAALSGELTRRTGAARLVHTVLGTGKERMNRLHKGTITAVSGDTRRRLIEAGVQEERITVIAPLSICADYLIDAAELETIRQTRISRPVCRFVSVAMFAPGKGQEQLLRRFAQLADRAGTDFELVLVGDGPQRPLCETLAHELGIAKNVTFAGAHKDVRPFLDDADCFVHHAVTETFGMVMVEAGARDLPTVAANVGGISDIVINGETGILVDFDDDAAFVDALKKITDTPQLRCQLGKAARMRVKDKLVKDAILPQYLALYAGS